MNTLFLSSQNHKHKVFGQVFNQFAMDEVKHVLAAVLTVAAGIVTAALFVLIALGSRVQLLFVIAIGCCGLTMVVVLRQIMLMMGRIATASAQFPVSFRKELKLDSVNRLALKACPVIYIQAGNFLRISSSTFSTLMVDVVVASVINLLVMTDSWSWM